MKQNLLLLALAGCICALVWQVAALKARVVSMEDRPALQGVGWP